VIFEFENKMFSAFIDRTFTFFVFNIDNYNDGIMEKWFNFTLDTFYINNACIDLEYLIDVDG
jgi:hypothetical protein